MNGWTELEQDFKTIIAENDGKLSLKEVLGKLESSRGVPDPGAVLLGLLDRGDIQVTIDWKVRLNAAAEDLTWARDPTRAEIEATLEVSKLRRQADFIEQRSKDRTPSKCAGESDAAMVLLLRERADKLEAETRKLAAESVSQQRADFVRDVLETGKVERSNGCPHCAGDGWVYTHSLSGPERDGCPASCHGKPLNKSWRRRLPTDIQPDWQDGVPECSKSCQKYDGEICRLMGVQPDRICEPMVIQMSALIEALDFFVKGA